MDTRMYDGATSVATPTAPGENAVASHKPGHLPPSRPGRSPRLIGDVVVDLGLATREAVETAVATSRAQGKPTGQVLLDSGLLREDQLARVLSERFGVDYVDLSVYDVDMGAVSLIGAEPAKRYQSVPVGFLEDGSLLLAMADPTNVLTIDDITMITGLKVRPAAASAEDIRVVINRLNRLDDSVEEVEEPQALAEALQDGGDAEGPIIKLVHTLIGQAVEQGVSDIHCDPEAGDMRVLYRLDGVLYPAATVPRRMAPGLVSRIKIMASLDIAEKRFPQDGRLAVAIDGRRVDVRVVTLPVVGGEAVVMRILDTGATVRDLESLGMLAGERTRFSAAISKPNGCVLVTGPTGSGKSTTLYTASAAS
jgi:type IV pilus assembly protein PilB